MDLILVSMTGQGTSSPFHPTTRCRGSATRHWGGQGLLHQLSFTLTLLRWFQNELPHSRTTIHIGLGSVTLYRLGRESFRLLLSSPVSHKPRPLKTRMIAHTPQFEGGVTGAVADDVGRARVAELSDSLRKLEDNHSAAAEEFKMKEQNLEESLQAAREVRPCCGI